MVDQVRERCLLIVGAGAEQERIYEVARTLGCSIVCSDGNARAPMVDAADHFLHVSTHDAIGTASAALSFSNTVKEISGVVTLANDCAHTVAFTAELLALPGVRTESALLSRDKWRFKMCMKDAGIWTPEGVLVSDQSSIEKAVRQLSCQQLIVKPVTGRGSEGVSLVDSRDVENILEAWRAAADVDPNKSVLMEQFVEGIQLSTESFVQQGKVYTPVLCERNYERLAQFSPQVIEDGGTIPALLDLQLEHDVRSTLERVAEALGVEDGSVKGDLVVGPQGVCVLEVALRLSGGWFASDQIRMASGVDLVKAVVLQALGQLVSVSDLTPSYCRATAIRYWFPSPGRIMAIEGVDRTKQMPGVERVDLSYRVGDELRSVRSHRDRFGSVLCSGDTRDEALSNVARALASVRVATGGESDE